MEYGWDKIRENNVAFAERDIMKKKIKVWVKAPCDIKIQKILKEKFGENCIFQFGETDDSFPTNFAEVIIGEPTREEILEGKNIQWIQLTWAGADKYVNQKDIMSHIILTNASGAFGKIIAEYVIGMIIALYRNFPKYWDNQQNCSWMKIDSEYTIYGKNVLILGTGDIGKNIACRLKAFDAHVNGIRRKKVNELANGFDHVFDLSSLDELLPNADIIIGCLPDTVETRGLITYDRLKRMKKDAVLINVGRGSLINIDDLAKVMNCGHLKGAALDVFEEEPLSAESPLWNMENVIITPHIAGPSFGENEDVQDRIWKICIDNIERFINGKELINIVNYSKGY